MKLAAVVLVLIVPLLTAATGPTSQAQRDFEENPGGLAIDSGRWSVLIEQSNNGLDLLGSTAGSMDRDTAAYLFDADAAQKAAALDLVQLRNRLLSMKLVKRSDLRPLPAWILEPPTAKVSVDTLDAHLRWIDSEGSKLVEIGCDIGRRKADDELFCSVE